MKFWLVLVAATLLAGCGAQLPPPESAPPPSKIWGYLGLLGEAAENATARFRGAPLVQKLQVLVSELRAEAAEAGARAAEYGAEARAALEQTWGDVKNRGVSYGRKLRRRLNRDGDELRRRWDDKMAALNHQMAALGDKMAALGDKMAALRRTWRGDGGDAQEPQNLKD